MEKVSENEIKERLSDKSMLRLCNYGGSKNEVRIGTGEERLDKERIEELNDFLQEKFEDSEVDIESGYCGLAHSEIIFVLKM